VVVFLAQLFRDLETRVRVIFEEAQEILALDEVDLARVDGLGGQFIGLAGNRSAETQNFAGFGNFQDQGLAVGRTNRELHPPFAEDKYAARGLSFDKQHRSFGISSGVLDGFERLQCGGRQVAENAIGRILQVRQLSLMSSPYGDSTSPPQQIPLGRSSPIPPEDDLAQQGRSEEHTSE